VPAVVAVGEARIHTLQLRNTSGIRPLILGCVMASRKAVFVTPSQAMAPRNEDKLTPEDIAIRLNYPSVKTVYEQTRLRNVRPMPCMRAGKFLRFYWSDVERGLRGEEGA
jgi:hypothetical protein